MNVKLFICPYFKFGLICWFWLTCVLGHVLLVSLQWHAWKVSKKFAGLGGHPPASQQFLLRLQSIIDSLELCHWKLTLETGQEDMLGKIDSHGKGVNAFVYVFFSSLLQPSFCFPRRQFSIHESQMCIDSIGTSCMSYVPGCWEQHIYYDISQWSLSQ